MVLTGQVMPSDGRPFASAYDSSEMESELATWDVVKGSWDDAESERVEERTLVPMRQACSLLGQAASEVQSQVAMLEQELDEIETM